MSDSATFNAWQSLKLALRAVFADRLWWLKIAIGGGWMVTLLGIIMPQGFLIEYLDNIKRGYRTPLPMWRQWSDKAVMGLLATVIDFVYFLFPVLGLGVLLFCVVVPLLLQASTTATSVIVITVLMIAFLISFLSSVSPISKIRFSSEGDIEGSLGMVMMRRALNPLYRGIYRQARIATIPLYIPALIAGSGLWWVITHSNASMLLLLLTGWLTGCCLFWAWLVVGQVYHDAAAIVQDREIDARLAERKRNLSV